MQVGPAEVFFMIAMSRITVLVTGAGGKTGQIICRNSKERQQYFIPRGLVRTQQPVALQQNTWLFFLISSLPPFFPSSAQVWALNLIIALSALSEPMRPKWST
jgi:hypothetical protein